MVEIIFWQGIVSPHMACLANALANLGHNVRYMAVKPMSKDRLAQGWSPPKIKDVQLDYIIDLAQVEQLLKVISPEAVHLVQGIRGNGYVGHVFNRLRQRQARCGAIMETVKETVVSGAIKRLVYRWKLSRSTSKPDFVLAIGEKTPDWVAARNYPVQQIFPFTYFLEPGVKIRNNYDKDAYSFRIGFAGQLNRGKRVDILIDALSSDGFRGLELVIVGKGPLEDELKTMAQKKLNNLNVQWLGQLPMEKARSEIADMDCLVLPSRHDGWGAVISEALLAGVPAICSDACGAAVAVRASGVGGVFPNGDSMALRKLLSDVKEVGRLGPSRRQELARWARCLGVTAGADYLTRILEFVYHKGNRPLPPWTVS